MIKKKLIPIYKEVVRLLSETSTCDRARVGAILVRDGRIISSAYNGSPEGTPSCDEQGHIILDDHCVRSCHAEMNLILHCAKNGIIMKDCDVVSSHYPCLICTKMLYQAGITRVYFVGDYRNGDNLFKELLQMEKI